jgi:ectoine hydroxylase-related dioxygenase (phytanoyl-CoA dioxygenase family)
MTSSTDVAGAKTAATMAPTSREILDELNGHFRVTAEQVRRFREDGYVKLKGVFSAGLIEHYGRRIGQKVHELNTMHLPMEQRSTYQKAFLQVMNIWRNDEVVREFTMSRRLGRIATELMGTRGVRLYHDQALCKEPSGGITPWHADQYYWPLSNPNTCTAWVPLQGTPMELGPLGFAVGSQNFQFGRDLEISDESESQLQAALEGAKFRLDDGPFELGEVSFHYGWTYHRAGANTGDRRRDVMTVIYMDEDMKVAEPRNKNQVNDLRDWLPGARVGGPAATELNPVIYSAG